MTTQWPAERLRCVRAEIELLEASMPLPGEFQWLSDVSRPTSTELPAFALRLSPDLVLSVRYDSHGDPNVSVSSDSLSRQRQIELSHLATELSQRIKAQGSETPVYELLTTLQEDLAAISDDEGGSVGEPEHAPTAAPARSDDADVLAILWAHHLLATSKRRDLVAWSSELSITGFAKPGYPGVMVAIGAEGEVNELLRRIKQLQWYALQVRHQDRAPSQARHRLHEALGGGWRERETMSEATKLADSAGFRDVFLSALKIV